MEFQSSNFDALSSQAVQNVMQEVLLFSELSSREQLAHIEMDPPAEIEDSSFFHDGVQFLVSARNYSPTQMVKLNCQRRHHHHQHRQLTMRLPSSFSGLPIDEWHYTTPLAPAVPQLGLLHPQNSVIGIFLRDNRDIIMLDIEKYAFTQKWRHNALCQRCG